MPAWFGCVFVFVVFSFVFGFFFFFFLLVIFIKKETLVHKGFTSSNVTN